LDLSYNLIQEFKENIIINIKFNKMTNIYILFHGKYNSIDKEIVGIYSSIESAKAQALIISKKDASSGIGMYTEGPGISYPKNSGILFRGKCDNPYSLWVVETVLLD
jgi:hypothetical protein